LTIQTYHYQANLEGNIVYVRKEGEGWRYSAKIWPIEEIDKRHYMQIIYDRLHSLPKQMDPWITAYDDILRNIKKRVIQPLSDKRKSARIQLYYPVTFENGTNCVLRSFNYRYFSASDFSGEDLLENEFTLLTQSKIKILLKRTGITVSKNKEELLLVENLESLIEQNLLEKLLEELMLNSNRRK
jgi:cellulose synthase (UDP-forming)